MIAIDFPPITVFTSKLYIYFIGSSTWFCDVYRNVGWKNSAAQKKKLVGKNTVLKMLVSKPLINRIYHHHPPTEL